MRDRRAYMAAYNAARKVSRSNYATTHPEANARNHAAYHARLKLAALNAYGGPKCSCCGETLLEGLSIDHIGGGGAEHRRELKKTVFYKWLRDNGFPSGYRVLCMTCNFAGRILGYCPHEDGRIAWG